VKMKIRALIVDEPLARERIRTLLGVDPDIEIVHECVDGREAVTALQEHIPDLLFLDVQMPVMDGFCVLEKIAVERMPVVIFVTAYDEYALRAFDVHALDYLLKPFDRERFQGALQRAKVQIRREKSGDFNQRLLALLEDLRNGQRRVNQQEYLTRLVIRSAGRVFFLSVEEIDWIEAAGNYLRLHVGKESHLLRETMSAIESKLEPKKFLRIHRSTIVNIDRIKELSPLFKGEHVLTMQDGAHLTSSRSYRKQIHKLLENSF